MTISGFAAYIKQLWKNKPDTSTPVSAERLGHIEDGIKGNSDAIEAIAAAVLDSIINDPNKIASMAAVYALQQNLQGQITTLNSNLEISQYDFTSAEGITVESTSKVCKFGSIAIANLRIGALPTISADGWITIATMPFSSKYNVYFDSMLYTTLGTSPIVRDGMITANAIKIYANTSDSGKRFRIAVPFIVS